MSALSLAPSFHVSPKKPIAKPRNHDTAANYNNLLLSIDVVAAACHNDYLSTQWRTSLGIGCVFPLVLFVLRLYVKEPEEFTRNSMRHVRTPYWLVLRFYGFRLLIASLIWFIYDVSPTTFLPRLSPQLSPFSNLSPSKKKSS